MTLGSAPPIARTMLTAALLVTVAACHHQHKAARAPHPPSNRQPTAPLRVYVGYSEQGTASWYGVPYHGRPAADGEIYNMETLVAAHRLMPFNTWLRVTNLQNQKTVDVRVIDRGPFVENRIIDLSKAAARQIDLLGPGIGPVRLEVISAPADVSSNDYFAVQAGAFTVYANAEHAREEYARRFGAAQIESRQGNAPLYRVLVGKERSLADAQQIADRMHAEGRSAFVVRLDETLTGQPPAPLASPSHSPSPPLP